MEYAVKLAVGTLVTILASTIKNPKSDKARRARKYVAEIHDAAHQFLVATAVDGDEAPQ